MGMSMGMRRDCLKTVICFEYKSKRWQAATQFLHEELGSRSTVLKDIALDIQ